jgi:hypothetical protein
LTLATWPVLRDVTVIVASGTTALVWSVTVPWMLPWLTVVWASAEKENIDTSKTLETALENRHEKFLRRRRRCQVDMMGPFRRNDLGF